MEPILESLNLIILGGSTGSHSKDDSLKFLRIVLHGPVSLLEVLKLCPPVLHGVQPSEAIDHDILEHIKGDNLGFKLQARFACIPVDTRRATEIACKGIDSLNRCLPRLQQGLASSSADSNQLRTSSSSSLLLPLKVSSLDFLRTSSGKGVFLAFSSSPSR